MSKMWNPESLWRTLLQPVWHVVGAAGRSAAIASGDGALSTVTIAALAADSAFSTTAATALAANSAFSTASTVWRQSG